MERLTLDTEQQAYVDGYHTDHSLTPGASCNHAGTNIVIDDHLLMFDTWLCVVLGPSVDSEGCLDIYTPGWGMLFYMPVWGVEGGVNDRAGPNGQTMPVYDEPPEELLARSEDAPDPKAAKKAQRERLHAFLAGQPKETAKQIRKHLRIEAKE
jgi:hypothetical protein